MIRHRLISFFVVLTLALTSQAMAVARGATVAVDAMVICNGAGTMTVYIDAEGHPTAAPHICPDCALHAAVATDPPAPACLRTGRQVERALNIAMLALPAHPPTRPHSRAPPRLV